MKIFPSIILITLLSFNMFSQMTLVPGQPERSIYDSNRTIKANDNIGFVFFYSDVAESEVYLLEDGYAEAIVWTDTPSNFNPFYKGQLGEKYYFFNVYGSDGLLYEYDHSSSNTRKIPLPSDHTCDNTRLLIEGLNGKLYYACGTWHYGDSGILSFDGNNFEYFESPPNHFILGLDHLYVESLNQVIIWYEEGGPDNLGAKVHTFDGSSVAPLTNPTEDMTSARFGVHFEDYVLLPYIEFIGDNDGIYYLYKYDGSDLVEIPGLPSTVFHNMRFFKKDEKVYIALDNYDNLSSSLYEYDGNRIVEVFNSTYFNPQFITEFDGKDFFSLADMNLVSTDLYSYDGNTIEKINGPSAELPIRFGGIINNTLQLVYYDNLSEESRLFSYSSGDSEVHSVLNMPQEVAYGNFQFDYNNFLLHTFRVTNESFLYTQHESEQFGNIDPENHVVDRFELQLGNKIYYSYYNDSWKSHLYVWDGILDTPNFDMPQNDIVVHPNPAIDIVNLEIPKTLTSQNLELSLLSIDGKMIKKQSWENNNSQLQISLENLVSGIYILELKGETSVIRKKIVKK